MKDSGQNTITLRELVDFYIQQGMMKSMLVNTQEKKKISPFLQDQIISSIRSEVQHSLTAEEADAIHRTAKAMQRQQEIQQRTQQIRNLLFEGIVLAFFVGILVNLATDLLNTFFPNHKVTIAVICIIIVAILYFSRLLDQFQALLHPDPEGDSDPK